MKVLSVTNCPLDPVLGSGKAVLRYTEGLRRRGHDVKVYEPADFEKPRTFSCAPQYRQALGAWQVLRKVISQNRFDLVEFYGAEFGLLAESLSRRMTRPLLVQHTNGFELLAMEQERRYPGKMGIKERVNRWVVTRLGWKTFKHTDAFVCMCEADREHAVRLGLYHREATAVVRHGIDEVYRDRPYVERKEQRVACMGSWIPRKGIDRLVAVCTMLLERFGDLTLHLYGTGAESRDVLSCFHEGVRDRVFVYPRLRDREVADGLTRAKVFFFPSRYEGFGLAITEAMACSCAVVITPTGFGGDVRNQEEAMVCDYDDVRGMFKAIALLLEDDDVRDRIARTGWKLAQQMTWEAAARELEHCYERWLSRGQIAGKTWLKAS